MSTQKKIPNKAKTERTKQPGDKYYFIDRNNITPRIFFGEVDGIQTSTLPLKDEITGKILGAKSYNVFQMKTAIGIVDVMEDNLFKSFPSVAVEFSKEFLITEN